MNKHQEIFDFRGKKEKSEILLWLNQLLYSIVKPTENTDTHTYTLTLYFRVLQRLLDLGCPNLVVMKALDIALSDNISYLKPFSVEIITQTALWLPKLQVNFVSPYRLPMITDLAKYAACMDINLMSMSPFLNASDVLTMSEHVGGLAILQSDIIKTSSSTRSNYNQNSDDQQHRIIDINEAVERRPNEVHILSCIEWDKRNNMVIFYIPRSTYHVLVERRYVMVLFEVKTWRSYGNYSPMYQAREYN